MVKIRKLRPQDVSMEEALSQFLLFRRARGIADSTLEGHKYIVSALIKRCETWDDIFIALNDYMSEEIRNNTYNLRIKFLKPFFEFCLSEAYITENPFSFWKQRKTETRIVNVDEDALGKLVSAPNLNTFAGIRDYALILLQLDTGIRPKEALTLIETDVCFNQMLVNIKAVNSKTKNTRSLPISPITAQAIKKLLSFKHELWRTDLVFCTFDGKPVDRRNWSRRLAYYSEKINYKIRPYDLRHSFALYYLRAGGDVFSLQKMMGHTNLAMTQKYIALTDQDLRNQHAKSSPLNTITKAKRIRNL